MKQERIKDVMTPDPVMIHSTQSVRDAARLMKQMDCGILPVGTPDNVVGVITDRDIVLRVLAQDQDPARVHVHDVMTTTHYSCPEDSTLEQAAHEMRERRVSRLLVRRGDKIVGMVSLADLLQWPQSVREVNHIVQTILGRAPAHAH